MKWFNNPKTLEELKQQYKKLALKHHPDLGGNTADYKKSSTKTYSLDEIRDLYGSETIKANPQLELAIV